MGIIQRIRKDIDFHRDELIRQIDVLLVLYMVAYSVTTSLNGSNKYCNFIASLFMLFAVLYCFLDCRSLVSVFSVSYLLFVIYSFLTVLWSPLKDVTLETSITFARLLLISVLIYNYLDSQGKKDLVLRGFVISGLIVCFYIILFYSPKEYLQGIRNNNRMGWDIVSINQGSLFLMTDALICFWFVLFRKRWWDIVPALMFIFVAIGMGSRAAILVFAVGLFVLLFLCSKGKWRIIIPVLMIAAGFIGFKLLSLPAFGVLHARLESFLKVFTDRSQADGSTTVRIDMLGWGLKQFLKTPVFGLGIQTGGVVMAEYNTPLDIFHNLYVELLSGGGIVGFSLYFFLWIYPFVKLIKPALKGRDDAVISIVLIAVMASGFVFGSEYTEKPFSVVLCYLFLTVSHYKKEGYLK